MKFDVLTLFPEMFETLTKSITGKAIEKELININLINIRDFSKDKHKHVDDTPYGGGAGMLIRPDVVYDAYQSVKDENAKLPLEQANMCQDCYFKWENPAQKGKIRPSCFNGDDYCQGYFKYHDVQKLFMEEYEVEE